jgi:hypothetical protein
VGGCACNLNAALWKAVGEREKRGVARISHGKRALQFFRLIGVNLQLMAPTARRPPVDLG